MSCIAYRDGLLAADRQGTAGYIRCISTKLHRADNGDVMATVGNHEYGMAMRIWYSAGADPDAFPEPFDGEGEEATLIVLGPRGVFTFDRRPIACPIEDAFFAWGSGREVALGAMHMGADARTAVEAACVFCVGCGHGVETMQWETHNAIPAARVGLADRA